MPQTTNFTDGKRINSSGINNIQAAVLENAQLKLGKKKLLPEFEAVSTMIYTNDTDEIYIGGGNNSPIRKLSEVKVFKAIDNFPVPGVENRLYVAEESNSIHFWSGEEYKMISAGGGSGEAISLTPRVIEFDSKEDFPQKGIFPAIYIARATGVLYRYDEKNGYRILCKTEQVDRLSQDIEDIKEKLKDLKGMDGAAGKDGKSAFDIAVENGFTGTETDWLLSLKGKDGEAIPGERGPQGDRGADGSQGANGDSAYAVALRGGFTGDETEWLTSLKGENGTNGAPGANGKDGRSAYQLAVDNGYVGLEIDWIKSLRGEQGPKGDIGPQGDKGEQGSVGIKKITFTVDLQQLSEKNEITVMNEDIKSSSIVMLAIPVGSDDIIYEAVSKANIICTAQSEGNLTLKLMGAIPEASFNIDLIVTI